MSAVASNPPLRLVAVAADVQRARSLAENVASAFATAVETRIVGTVAEALATLRREPCDALLALHEPPRVDGLVLARALRGAGDETPLAVLGGERAIDLEAAAWDAGADEYACLAETTSTQLAGRLRRAIDARERLRQTRRALQAEQQRLAREQEQNERLVRKQHRLLDELRRLPEQGAAPLMPAIRSAFGSADAYASLVRGALLSETPDSRDLSRLADGLAAEGTTGPRLLELHLAAVEESVVGLEPRAVQAVREQADRLLFEAIVHLAEAYRRRYLQAVPTAEATPAARAA